MQMIFSVKKQLIAEIIRTMARSVPFKPAIISEAVCLTYQELDKKSNALANAIIAKGIKPQSRIAYLGKESDKYYVLLFACAKANCVLVPINWRLKANEVSYILSDSESAILFIDEETQAILEEIQYKPLFVISLQNSEYLEEKYDKWIHSFSKVDPFIPVFPTDTFAQIYTSGTTGLPKGVEIQHKSFFQIRNSLIQNNLTWIDWRSDDISLIGIPGFHIGGLWWALQGFSSGITQICLRVFHASVAIEIIRAHKVTIACVVPAMIHMILKESENLEVDFSSLRKVIYGGSPISESLLEKAIAILNCEFVQIYGLTETGNTAICLPPEVHFLGSRHLKAAGRPYPCVKVEIKDQSNACLPPFEIGEVFLFSPANMKGFWKLSDKTLEVLQSGWIKTGDAGYLDTEGYLFICDRIKDVIIVAGEKIYPTEVENALLKHPLVQDAAVVGIPHEEWGESIYSFIVSHDVIKPIEIISFLRQLIADYKIPSQFIFIDEIPRNPSGKILKRELRALQKIAN